MDRLKVSTVIYAPPERVYDFLVDFEGYGKYSEYVDSVRADGDGGVGTTYSIEFGWWKLTYVAQSRVTGMERPNRIDWEITKDIDAVGHWAVESVDVPADAPDDVDDASRITLDVEFDPSSVGPRALDLPVLVDVDWVIKKAVPLVTKQAETVLRRVVADLEGRPRSPELVFHVEPDSVDESGPRRS